MYMPLKFYRADKPTGSVWTPDETGLMFRGAMSVEESKSGSAVIDKAWVRVISAWGRASFTLWFDECDGKGISNTGSKWTGAVGLNRDAFAIPDRCRMLRIEGQRDSMWTIVDVRTLPLGK